MCNASIFYFKGGGLLWRLARSAGSLCANRRKADSGL